jgi:hypothetical protein
MVARVDGNDGPLTPGFAFTQASSVKFGPTVMLLVFLMAPLLPSKAMAPAPAIGPGTPATTPPTRTPT